MWSSVVGLHGDAHAEPARGAVRRRSTAAAENPAGRGAGTGSRQSDSHRPVTLLSSGKACATSATWRGTTSPVAYRYADGQLDRLSGPRRRAGPAHSGRHLDALERRSAGRQAGDHHHSRGASGSVEGSGGTGRGGEPGAARWQPHRAGPAGRRAHGETARAVEGSGADDLPRGRPGRSDGSAVHGRCRSNIEREARALGVQLQRVEARGPRPSRRPLPPWSRGGPTRSCSRIPPSLASTCRGSWSWRTRHRLPPDHFHAPWCPLGHDS